MLETNIREQIIQLIHCQVVPAVGCTEPMAVALCTARAAELLNQRPENIYVRLSANILKNAMGVGIPGTGMIGLPIAIALGALIGKSEYQLEVIKDLTPATLEQGKTYISENRIDISLKEGITEKLYIEVTCVSGEHKATVIIAGSHTHIVFEQVDDNVLVDKRNPEAAVSEATPLCLNLQTVWDFAMTTPIEEIDFILEAKRYNLRAAAEAVKGNYGHCLGKIMDRPLSRGIFGNSIFSHIIAKTASACDAREELVRALILSHLTAIYIKQSLGALSALCGCVVASIGSSCGITYLMGGNYANICNSVKNMIANLTGMICDGAKPSCSLKISSGVSTAILSATLSMEGKCVTAAEGIIDNDVDKSIRNLTSIGKEAMCNTDDMVLNIMTNKCN